jgi:MOSC domain-containing protein YiiM
MEAIIVSVSCDPDHNFSKQAKDYIVLTQGLGVEGDAHFGTVAQHRSIVRKDPTRPNTRQVHLIHSELFEELRAANFAVSATEMGENILTKGIDLLGLPMGARLHMGETAIVEVTGLRNPCRQIDAFQAGLKDALLCRNKEGELFRKAGIMGVVAASGVVRPGDSIRVEMPAGELRPLIPL